MILFAQSSAYRRPYVLIVNTTTEAWRTLSRFSGLVYRADRRRLTCVLNAAVDIVYRVSTVVPDVV